MNKNLKKSLKINCNINHNCNLDSLAFLHLFALFTYVALLNLSLCNVKIIYPHSYKRYSSLLKIFSSPLTGKLYFKTSYVYLWHDPTRHDKPASGVIGCNKRRKGTRTNFFALTIIHDGSRYFEHFILRHLHIATKQ